MEWLFNELKQYVGSIGCFNLSRLARPFRLGDASVDSTGRGWTAILHFPGRVFQLVRALLQQVRRPRSASTTSS